jgi:hypothetical protein
MQLAKLSRGCTENLFTFDVKSILRVNFNVPYHHKLMQNIYNKSPRMSLDNWSEMVEAIGMINSEVMFPEMK